MIKDILKVKEPVVYQSILNALENQKLGHCFLMAGPKNPLKLDTAFLLAQSIIEGNNTYACETCDICRRVKNLEYYDLRYIDGSKDTIKIEMIEELFDEFAKTTLEAKDKKIYIINNINNASTKVLNAILKFMEEPPSDNIYGILITDQIDNLLPTIVSRCQTVYFRALNIDELKQEYLALGFDDLDAYFIANVLKRYEALDLNDKYYHHAKDMVLFTLEALNNPHKLSIEYYTNGYGVYKDSNEIKQFMQYYFGLMIIYLNDAIKDCSNYDLTYQKELNELKKYPIYELLEIFLRAYDKTNMTYDKKLIFDQVAYEISKVI